MKKKEERIICPVPAAQIPTEEFRQLKTSWFFKLPLEGDSKFRQYLLTSWLAILPIMLIISTGSIYIRKNMGLMIILGFTMSLLAPLLLLLRQILCWSYINQRLISKDIEYEESGWWDGQVWEKPSFMREKDLLISQHEVKPIINQMRNNILIIFLTIIVWTSVLIPIII